VESVEKARNEGVVRRRLKVTVRVARLGLMLRVPAREKGKKRAGFNWAVDAVFLSEDDGRVRKVDRGSSVLSGGLPVHRWTLLSY
jgi:hypothetical protein